MKKPLISSALDWTRQNHTVNRLNGNSNSYMQEAFIFLLRFLAHTRHLPFNSRDGMSGSRKYRGISLWMDRQLGKQEEGLERFWIDMFINESIAHVPGPKCLEWGINYMNRYPQCTERYDLTYHRNKMIVEDKIIHGDLYKLNTIPIKFNLILATQVFEHLLEPERGAKVLFESLEPGGCLLYTAPQSSQFHNVPSDFARYTKVKIKEMFTNVGFCVPLHLMTSGGDFIFDAARALGMRFSDFNAEELDSAYVRGYKQLSEGAITIHALMFKPPHRYCN